MALIHEKLIAINKEVGAIGKNKKNEQQGFKFRGIDDVMNELHHLFAKHEVLILPNAQSFETSERATKNGTALFSVRATIKYTFVASDGSELSCVLIGEAMDSGDKGMNKALSIALKYALLQMFLIPTEDMKDPDAETHEVAPQPVKIKEPQTGYKGNGTQIMTQYAFNEYHKRIKEKKDTEVWAKIKQTYLMTPAQYNALELENSKLE